MALANALCIPETALDATLAFCDYAELSAACQVCRQWRSRASRSSLWRRIAQKDYNRARNTEYQIVAKSVQKCSATSSSFNTAHLYTLEVHTRQRRHSNDGDDAPKYNSNRCNSDRTFGYRSLSSYAADWSRYTFDNDSGGGNAASSGFGTGEVRRHPESSMVFCGISSAAEVRRVCMLFMRPLYFTAGLEMAAAARAARASHACTPSSSSLARRGDDGPRDAAAHPLWEEGEGSCLRDGALLFDPRDPGSFCFYASTPQRPWCTVVMDGWMVSAGLLQDYAANHEDGRYCLDLTFRIEELPILHCDAHQPMQTIVPLQPASIRVGVVEQAQLPLFQRSLQHVREATQFSCAATLPPATAGREGLEGASRVAYKSAEHHHADTWAALDGPPLRGSRHGVTTAASSSSSAFSSSYLSRRRTEEELQAAAEAEVAAWFDASLREAQQAEVAAAARHGNAGLRPLEPQLRSPVTTMVHKDLWKEQRGVDYAACAVGDTPFSYGYDKEGNHVSDGTSYPLGSPLANGDVVHVQFFLDEDVIVICRNAERLGTLVADAFSDQQRWCVAVSLQNCGVRLVPPQLL